MDEMSKDGLAGELEGVSAESAWLRVLSAFAIDLVGIASGQDLAWYVARQVVQKLGFVDCVIYYLDTDENLLRQVAAIGEKNPVNDEIYNALVIPVGQGITGTVAQNREPMIDNNLSENDLYIADIDRAQSELCVPLAIGERVYGVIDCEHPELDYFTGQHLEQLTAIAALTSARLRLIEQGDHLELMQELKFGEDRFHDFIDVASDWYWELDEDLRYRYIFDKVALDREYTKSFFLGKRRSDMKPDVVDADQWQAHLEDLDAHRPFRNFVQSQITRDGQQIWQSVTGKPWFDNQGQFKGYRAAASDITDYHNMERNLRKTAEAANEAKSQFLASISHELRTPLTSSLGSLGLLKELAGEELSEQGRELLEIAVRNSELLLRLVNELLDYEKLQAGHNVMTNERYDLCQLTSDAVRDNQGFARANDLSFVLVLPPVPLYAQVEAQRFKQVIANLLSNAAKFSAPGRDVEVSVQAENGQVVVSVKDQGVGIPTEFYEDMFEPFRQADGSSTRVYGGTGLGLSLSKALVEQMGGTLDFQSKIGSGSTFFVAFPAAD